MRTHKLLLAVAWLACLHFSAGVTNAALLLNNLGTTAQDGIGVDIDTRVALGFNLNAAQGGDWTFTFRAVPGPGASSSSLLLQLYTDNASAPGTLSSLSLTQTGTTPLGGNLGSHYTYSASGNLAAGNYWLVASTESLSDFFTWANNGAYTQNGATHIGTGFNVADTGWQSTTAPLSVGIDVSPVPEPAHYGLAAALLLVVVSAREILRRRKVTS